MQNSKSNVAAAPTPARAGKAALFAFCILNCAVLAGGCAKAQAKASPDGPPLAVPTPPSRILAPVEEPLAENAPPAEPAATPPRTNASPARPTTPRRPTTTVTPPTEEPKPETPAAQTPPPVTEPPVVARPPPSPADVATERRVRDVMRKADADLKRVDYQKLSNDGKAQYEASKRFIEQAETALKDRNYAFALTVADKAAGIATELLAAR